MNTRPIEIKIHDIFGKIYRYNGAIYVPLEDNKTKVKNIKKVKDYLNNNVSLYVLEIVFLGGVAQEYHTALRIQILT